MKLSYSVSRGPRAGSAPATRKAFTGSLDLPTSATDAEVLATLDARLAANKPAVVKATASSADEALYRTAFGK